MKRFGLLVGFIVFYIIINLTWTLIFSPVYPIITYDNLESYIYLVITTVLICSNYIAAVYLTKLKIIMSARFNNKSSLERKLVNKVIP